MRLRLPLGIACAFASFPGRQPKYQSRNIAMPRGGARCGYVQGTRRAAPYASASDRE
jgi:hypothetical protein